MSAAPPSLGERHGWRKLPWTDQCRASTWRQDPGPGQKLRAGSRRRPSAHPVRTGGGCCLLPAAGRRAREPSGVALALPRFEKLVPLARGPGCAWPACGMQMRFSATVHEVSTTVVVPVGLEFFRIRAARRDFLSFFFFSLMKWWKGRPRRVCIWKIPPVATARTTNRVSNLRLLLQA